MKPVGMPGRDAGGRSSATGLEVLSEGQVSRSRILQAGVRVRQEPGTAGIRHAVRFPQSPLLPEAPEQLRVHTLPVFPGVQHARRRASDLRDAWVHPDPALVFDPDTRERNGRARRIPVLHLTGVLPGFRHGRPPGSCRP